MEDSSIQISKMLISIEELIEESEKALELIAAHIHKIYVNKNDSPVAKLKEIRKGIDEAIERLNWKNGCQILKNIKKLYDEWEKRRYEEEATQKLYRRDTHMHFVHERIHIVILEFLNDLNSLILECENEE